MKDVPAHILRIRETLISLDFRISEDILEELYVISEEVAEIREQHKNQEHEGEIIRLLQEIEKLKKLVFEDELTKVYNRRGFYKIFDPIFTNALNYKMGSTHGRHLEFEDFSIIFVDCDNFKSINDTYGHDTGDIVLRECAELLKKHTRNDDGVGRLGGEEFVVALPAADEDCAYKKAQEILSDIRENIKIPQDRERIITASIGVSSLTNSDASTLDELVGYADQAMYEAKTKRGKNTVVKFSEIK